MSVVGAIASFATGEYTRIRRAAGSTDATGDYVPGAESYATITANVQPPTAGEAGATLRALPEGYRVDDLRVAYTTSELRAGADGDEVVLDGFRFAVHRVERWDAFGDSHYRALLASVIPLSLGGAAVTEGDDALAAAGSTP